MSPADPVARRRTTLVVAVVLAATLVAAVAIGSILRGGDRSSGVLPTSSPTPSGPSGSVSLSPTTPSDTGSDRPAPCPSGLPAEGLTVATFNIHYAERHGRVDLEGIAAEIRALDADLVVVQEVDRARPRSAHHDEPRELAALLRRDVVYGIADRLEGRPGRVGNAVVSRLPVLARRVVPLPARPGVEDRSVLRVTVQWHGAPVDVYATHLDHSSTALRQAQARAVAALVSRDRRPVVLGADLNATPDSPVHARLTDTLTDAWLEAGTGGGETVPGGAHPRRRIDVVLHNASFIAERADVVGSTISDHHAVLVHLRGVPDPGCG